MNYIDKQELLDEIITSQDNGRISERLGEMCMEIGKRLLYHKNFVGYHSDLKEEMFSTGTLYCCKYLLKNFDRNKKTASPFSYVTAIFFSAFINTLKKYYRTIEHEKKLIDLLQSSITDEDLKLLENMDMDDED